MTEKSIDANVVKEWAEKFSEFASRDADIVTAIITAHQGRTPAYYRELFALELNHYPESSRMTGPAQVKRYVANGALIAYSAHKILYPED